MVCSLCFHSFNTTRALKAVTMKTSTLVIISFAIFSAIFTKLAHTNSGQTYKLSEDGRLNFSEIVRKYGHQCNEHKLVTEDGYILQVFHIPGDSNNPILLIHGGTATVDGFVSRGNTSLAIALADKNYDVWAFAFRGSRYSRHHVQLDPEKDADKFFNFSFYEYAIYDIPNTLDYVLEKTNQTKLSVIGYSLGATSFFVTGAEKPEYNQKVDIFVSMAAMVYVKHVRGLMRFFLHNIGEGTLDILQATTGVSELLTHKDMAPLLQFMCLKPLFFDYCKYMAKQILGDDPEGFEDEFFQTFTGHYPGGTSAKYFRHIIQTAKRDKFAKYDYGAPGNLKVYGTTEAPDINFQKMTMNVALLVGREDPLSTVKDTERLRNLLPNVVYYLVHPYKKFNHFDFSWGRHMSKNLFPIVFELLGKYKKPPIKNVTKSKIV